MSDSAPKRKFLDQLRDILRAKHYSYSTEQTYVGWVRRYILFHIKMHPQDMGGQAVNSPLDR